MPKILQICVEPNKGSVGRIAEQIGLKMKDNGWTSYIAYGRPGLPSDSILIKIGNIFDIVIHFLITRLFDRHCLGSKYATKKFVKKIENLNPDVILLHHIHGYFINMDVLFSYFSEKKKKIYWIFHDCWAFTGHCAYFDFVQCDKWETECSFCVQKNEYPKSIFLDGSNKNFYLKKSLFENYPDLNIIGVSDWMSNLVRKSFLKKHNIITIHNGIDTKQFNRVIDINETVNKYNIKSKYIILGVASVWEKRKGLDEFIKLRAVLKNEFLILLVGLTKNQIKSLPKGIIGIERTESVKELASLYTIADVYLNLTLEDTYPTTNLESISCGTPVITYNTGGSIESINENTGIVVEKGNIKEVSRAINNVLQNGKNYYINNCKNFAKENFDAEFCFEKYLHLFNNDLKNNIISNKN
jgi:putative colanic acid biosynthesis glycosyltransferase